MRLQMATRHALFAALELAAQPDRYLSAAEIAEKYGISLNHLAKVLRTLGRQGLVEAARGVGGGYRFSANAKRLNLFEIISIFESVGTTTASEREAGDETAEGQALRKVIEEIEDMTQSTLSSITVDTMLKIVSKTNAKRAPATAAEQATG
jgi:Rrf2 family protein